MNKPIHISIDIETYSSVDIKTGGLYQYAQSPDFQILLFAYAVNREPVRVLDLAQGETIGEELCRLLFDEHTILHAYNAAFEWYCLSQHFRLSSADMRAWLPRWRCTMLHGSYCGYPAGLAACGAALGLPADKQKLRTGSTLIQYFCKPCKPTKSNGQRTRNLPAHEPERWKLFIEYNKQDVVAEQTIEDLLSVFPVPEDVQRGWEYDCWINLRGVAVDIPLVEGAIAIGAQRTKELTDEATQLSGLDNLRSIGQLTAWLRGELPDEDITTLRKEDVAALLRKDLPSSAAARLLQIRQEIGKTSVSKYDAISAGLCSDGRVRGLLRYYGAHTGRWAGRMVQPQNLPRTHLAALDFARERTRAADSTALRMVYGNVNDTLSQLIRTALVPAEGMVFIDADYSAIEARVLAWLAGENWVLDVFRTHGRIYEATAAQMFGVPLEKITKGQPEYELRQKGKVATLALGYGGSTGALSAMGALNMGLSESELPDIVQRWREANPNIVRLWYAVQSAVLDTVRYGAPHALPHLGFALQGDGRLMFLTITLPSGRALHYPAPRIGADRWGRESFAFMGGKGWTPTESWGGKLVENIVQAVSRDLLADAIERLEDSGFSIVFHVHDEVVIEASPDMTLEAVCRLMSQPPAWAEGLPLRAEGWTGDYYTKD